MPTLPFPPCVGFGDYRTSQCHLAMMALERVHRRADIQYSEGNHSLAYIKSSRYRRQQCPERSCQLKKRSA